jgi:fatty acid desaturase/ABC-type phosphate/phosphonate transport system substrate-binding protein
VDALDKTLLAKRHRPLWLGTTIWLGFLTVFMMLQIVLLGELLSSARWWTTAPLILVLAHLMHSQLIAFHEAAHESICPDRRLNDAIGLLIGGCCFMSLSLYRAVHRFHHAYLASGRDEELWPFNDPRQPLWLRRLAAAGELLFGLFYTPWLFLRSFLRRGSPVTNPTVRRRIWIELLAIGFAWTVTLATAMGTGTWSFLFIIYGIPAMLAGTMQSWRKYIEHVGLTGSTPLQSTRSIVSSGVAGRLLAFSLLHEPFHGIHHRYARLPHTALPEFAPLLFSEPTEEGGPYTSYRAAAKALLVSLRDPKVGSVWLGPKDARAGSPIGARPELPAATPAARWAIVVAALMIGTPAALAQNQSADPENLQIGIVKSLLRSDSEFMIQAMAEPFAWLVKAQTGLRGTLRPMETSAELGDLLEEKKVQLGIFQGIEFAWEQRRHPGLQPLMLVINQQPYLRACLVVRAGNGWEHFVQLKGKSLGQPGWSRVHCALFLDRLCRVNSGVAPAHYFAGISQKGDSEEWLDSVVDGGVDAALVEQVPLDCYRRRKPGRAAQLRVLEQSARFPGSVVAYRAGALSRSTLAQFRDGMLRADRSTYGAQLLTFWRLTGFVTVPEDFASILAKTVVAYPTPRDASLVER